MSEEREQPDLHGTPGASAEAEYERRRKRDRDRPAWARFVLFLFEPGGRQSTEAWGSGAEGERVVAARLAKVPGVIVIHDRKIPGSRANIDHIAIGPRGIYVIDAKKVTKGRVEVRRRGLVWHRWPVQLVVGGWNRSDWVQGMGAQVAAVRRALIGHPEAQDVTIIPMVAIVGAEWGWFANPLGLEGVWVGWPKAAAKMVGRSGPLTAELRRRLADVLVERLPMASGPGPAHESGSKQP